MHADRAASKPARHVEGVSNFNKPLALVRLPRCFVTGRPAKWRSARQRPRQSLRTSDLGFMPGKLPSPMLRFLHDEAGNVMLLCWA